MKNLTWQNPEQLFVAQELINKVKSKCCGIKDYHENHHLAMMSLTFRNSDKEDVKNYAAKHLEEMKKFNEQLSTVTEELT